MESNSIEVIGKENPLFIFIFEDGTIRVGERVTDDDLREVDNGHLDIVKIATYGLIPIETVMNIQVYSGGVWRNTKRIGEGAISNE